MKNKNGEEIKIVKDGNKVKTVVVKGKSKKKGK